MIIHISGDPGSGKTTLGLQIQKKYGNNIVVYDTDDFIQHHIKEGKELLRITSQSEYKKTWIRILDKKFSDFINANPNKSIVFVGVLDNFGPDDGTIYKLKQSDHAFYIDIPMSLLLKRYYTRICKERSTDTVSNKWYWEKVATNEFSIDSSVGIISSRMKYEKWHRDNGYTTLPPDKILKRVDKLLKQTPNLA